MELLVAAALIGSPVLVHSQQKKSASTDEVKESSKDSASAGDTKSATGISSEGLKSAQQAQKQTPASVGSTELALWAEGPMIQSKRRPRPSHLSK